MLNTITTSQDKVFDDAASAQMETIIADFGRMYRERNDALREVANAHHDALLRLSLPGGSEVTARTPGHPLPSAGDRVRIGVRGPVVAFRR